MPSPDRLVDVQEFIDGHALSALQRRVLVLCFFVVAIDGFDTALIGFVAPAIRAEWHLAVSSLGPLFAAGLVGLMLGAFAVGPLADRHGRRAMLVASMLVFGLASVASSLSPDLWTLTWLRVVTGIGLGGAMPTSITLASEYCPAQRRSSLVTLMFCGFTIGSAVGGLIAGQVLERYGWRPLFVGGGLVPLALAPVLWWTLPESVRYMVMRGTGRAAVADVLSRIAPEADLTGATFVGAKAPSGSPVRQLFSGGLVAGTLLLWLAFFMSLLVVYLLSNWMPTLMQRGTGMSLGRAALVTAMLQVGGTLGAIVVGRLMDAFNPHYVLGLIYACGAAFIVAISLTAAAPWLMAGAVFGAGFCVSGGQVGANALSAAFYPTPYRATGVSWANGVGRSGSIVGSLLGGGMLALGYQVTTVYALVAIPAVLAGAALVALGWCVARRCNPADTAATRRVCYTSRVRFPDAQLNTRSIRFYNAAFGPAPRGSDASGARSVATQAFRFTGAFYEVGRIDDVDPGHDDAGWSAAARHGSFAYARYAGASVAGARRSAGPAGGPAWRSACRSTDRRALERCDSARHG